MDKLNIISIAEILRLGFKLMNENTTKMLNKNGLSTQKYKGKRGEGRPNVVDEIKNIE